MTLGGVRLVSMIDLVIIIIFKWKNYTILTPKIEIPITIKDIHVGTMPALCSFPKKSESLHTSGQ